MMPLLGWGLDEAVETIALVFAAVSGLLFLLFRLERTLSHDSTAHPGPQPDRTEPRPDSAPADPAPPDEPEDD